MNMQVLPKRATGRLRRHRGGYRLAGRATPAGHEPAGTPTPAGRERPGPGPEDQALYTCSCGFMFEADVSTSVACPHCGAGQAW